MGESSIVEKDICQVINKAPPIPHMKKKIQMKIVFIDENNKTKERKNPKTDNTKYLFMGRC